MTKAGRQLPFEAFELHAADGVHFFSRYVPHSLRVLVESLDARAHVVDVGCGDGQLAWALLDQGLLGQEMQLIGVDISPVRVERFRRMTHCKAVLGDGEHLSVIDTASADLALSTMVMEHVPDDAAYARALARIVKPGGHLYLTTVLRKAGAWYFRKAPDGRRVLDPTHVREYGSVQEVVRMLEAAGFKLESCKLNRLWFPLAHPLVRWFNSYRPISNVQALFLQAPWRWIERLALPVLRYREIELVLCRYDPNPIDRLKGPAKWILR